MVRRLSLDCKLLQPDSEYANDSYIFVLLFPCCLQGPSRLSGILAYNAAHSCKQLIQVPGLLDKNRSVRKGAVSRYTR